MSNSQKATSPDMAALLHGVKCVSRRADKLRDRLAPGQYPIDSKAHFYGTLNVGEDSSFTRSVEPGADVVLAAMLQCHPRSSQLRRDLAAMLSPFARELEPNIDENFLHEAQDFLATLAHQVTAPRKGSVSGNIQFVLL